MLPIRGPSCTTLSTFSLLTLVKRNDVIAARKRSLACIRRRHITIRINDEKQNTEANTNNAK